MTDIVFKPERAPVVAGRGLYRAHMNKKPLDLLFRAKTAGEADEMLQFLLQTQTAGKTIDFNLKDYKKEAEDAISENEQAADAKEGGQEGKAGQDPKGD